MVGHVKLRPRARFTKRIVPTSGVMSTQNAGRHGTVFTNAAHLGKIADSPLLKRIEASCASRLIHKHKWEGIREGGGSPQKDGRRCVNCA